jgi:hypothetical protein
MRESVNPLKVVKPRETITNNDYPLKNIDTDKSIYESEQNINSEEEPILNNPSDFAEVISDADELDVPGSELDDAQEMIGSEDEENNFYSLGGDNHEN